MYTQGHTYNHTHAFLLSSDAALNCLFPFICFISNIRLNYIKLNRPHDRSTCYSAWCEKLAGSLLVVGDARPRLIIPRKKINKKVCEEHKKDCCSNREKKCWSRWEPLERGNEGTAFLCQAVDACCSYSTKQKKKSCSLQQNHSAWWKHTRCDDVSWPRRQRSAPAHYEASVTFTFDHIHFVFLSSACHSPPLSDPLMLKRLIGLNASTPALMGPLWNRFSWIIKRLISTFMHQLFISSLFHFFSYMVILPWNVKALCFRSLLPS